MCRAHAGTSRMFPSSSKDNIFFSFLGLSLQKEVALFLWMSKDYSFFMINNAFKTQLFQIIIEKWEFNKKMEKKSIIYIPP